MALHSVNGPAGSGADEGVDVDADASFFDMSPAGAEQVTLQIRSMMERAWEYIAIAYQGRAHIALGYESWDEYVDDRLGDLRLTVPRQERGAVVQSLSRAQMSLRAIAKVLGVDPATVHRALGAGDPAGADDANEPAPIRGRDGKSYARRRRQQVAIACSICVELHEESPGDCPWDLFAQGLGPRPDRVGVEPVTPERPPRSPGWTDTQARLAPTGEQGMEISSQQTVSEDELAPTIADSVTRAVCLVDELEVLPQLVDQIEVVGVCAGETGIAAGIRELIEHLRSQAAAMVSLVDRLERIASPT